MTDDGKVNGAARILIVEDEAILAEDLGISLENLGYAVIGEVSTGEQAIKLAQELRPDLILMDIKLQDDIDGIEAADRIRATLDIPVVYLTAYGEKDVLERAKRTEPYGYLGKPISLTEMRSTIETALYKHAADKRIRKSEEKYRFLAENMTDVIWTADAGPHLTYVSPSIEEHLGYTPEEFIAISLEDFVMPSSYQRLMEVFRQRGKQKNTGENGEEIRTSVIECRHKNGSVIPVEIVAKSLYDKQGNFSGILGVSRNVAERNKAEEALRSSEEKHRLLHETMTDAFVSVDLNGRILETNRAYQVMLGYSSEELLKLTYMDLTPAKWHDFEAGIVQEQILAKGYSEVYCKEYQRKDGTVFPVELRTSLIRDAAGNPSLMWAIVRDLTERTRAEKQLEASLREKEILLREIHHRVKNNLAVIQSMLRLQSRYAHSTGFSNMIKDAENRIRSMALAYELLYQSENLAEINLDQYVSKLLEHLHDSLSVVGRPIKIRSQIQDVCLGIDTAIPLGFIISELVSNCFKHAFPDDRRGEISVSLQAIGCGEFNLVVCDDGVKMPTVADVEYSGSMGLGLVRVLASQLNGTMKILQDKGTEVRIIFREA
jgi:PAS domain S-box-containing protein